MLPSIQVQLCDTGEFGGESSECGDDEWAGMPAPLDVRARRNGFYAMPRFCS